ncbi:MAG: hypothetical protein HC941_16980 [Microcoleus sp. SU_5_3]|nr:hypothetical protein [Microcoleus sp. SU_5_3]
MSTANSHSQLGNFVRSPRSPSLPSIIIDALPGCRSPQPTQIKPIQENTIALTRNSSPKLPHRSH